jgi:aspartate racemase
MQHIGIVGCSAEGAALCYRTICLDGAHYAHPTVTLHTRSLADYVRCLDAGDLDGVAALMLASAEALAKAGADFVICPDNTIHAALPRVRGRSPLPWLSIADAVAARAAELGATRPALLGTRWLCDSDVYPASWPRPRADEKAAVSSIIMDELVRGVIDPRSVARVHEIIARMVRDDGCDAVALCCTELPLIVHETHAPVPILDSTRLLARAALARASR